MVPKSSFRPAFKTARKEPPLKNMWKIIEEAFERTHNRKLLNSLVLPRKVMISAFMILEFAFTFALVSLPFLYHRIAYKIMEPELFHSFYSRFFIYAGLILLSLLVPILFMHLILWLIKKGLDSTISIYPFIVITFIAGLEVYVDFSYINRFYILMFYLMYIYFLLYHAYIYAEPPMYTACLVSLASFNLYSQSIGTEAYFLSGLDKTSFLYFVGVMAPVVMFLFLLLKRTEQRKADVDNRRMVVRSSTTIKKLKHR